MSAIIKFKHDDREGLVAIGSNLLDASRRMGVTLRVECEGRGECDSCAVAIEGDSAVLSPATDGERRVLGDERLASGHRLACQVTIERPGELIIELLPETARPLTDAERVDQFRTSFHRLPLQKKLATLFELETSTFFDTIDAVVSVPYKFGGKVVERLASRGRALVKKQNEEIEPKDAGE